MNPGTLAIVGIGPGAASMCTPEVEAALASATDLIGYGPYLDRVPPRPGLQRHASDNREELDRARHALRLAQNGAHVAVVSGGDAGVFAMASAIFEAIDHGDPAWRELDLRVLPGISAMFAVAARVGAPLGHDFCAISLSDNLKPWAVIEKRLAAAAQGGFVIALYNPLSRARPWQLGKAFEFLRQYLPDSVPVILAKAVTRPDENILLRTIGTVDPSLADMRTLVLIGSVETRVVERPGGRESWVYTPRGIAAS
jgi:precorrin-3B C17-methyltransferase